jgi:hypothetical protein
MEEDGAIFFVEPFTCDLCGCSVFIPLATCSKDDALFRSSIEHK